MSRYEAAEVTVANGSDIVRVVSGEFVNAIRYGENLEIGQFNGIEVLTTYTEVGTNDEIIQLAKPWPHATQTLESAVVVPTAVHFNDGADILKRAIDRVFTHLDSYFYYGNQASGTVTFKGVGVGNADTTVKCLKQWEADLSALEVQVTGSVDDVNAIDALVNTPTTGLVAVTAQAVSDLANIDGILAGYRSDTLGYKNTTLGYRNEVSTWHGEVDTWQQQVTTDAGTVSDELALTVAAKVAAVNAQTAAELAESNAVSIADGIAPDSLKLGGELPAHYATAASVTALDSNVGTATQTALDLKADSSAMTTALNLKPDTTTVDSALALKADASAVSNINNTSDSDKPISNLVQAALDEIEAVAIIGMF